MKQVYQSAGIPVAQGALVHNLQACENFVAEVGYPIVAKPDIGVGAAHTYKIHNDEELQAFWQEKPKTDYLLEEFVSGQIQSFDGLVDKNGEPVFFAVHIFSQGIMETVNKDCNLSYYSLREIPEDIEDAGRRVLQAFDLKERFFHLEFFRQDDGRLVALEVNLRPPGGLSTDMFNFANDIDIYREWANILVYNQFSTRYTRPYHCAYIGRKINRRYVYSHEDILRRWGPHIASFQVMSPLFYSVMGRYGYLARAQELETVLEIVQDIHREVNGE